jgi:hypothetical protein
VRTDVSDKYYRISESIVMEYMKRYWIIIFVEFDEYYLKKPIKPDFDKQLLINVAYRFPFDYMHYK